MFVSKLQNTPDNYLKLLYHFDTVYGDKAIADDSYVGTNVNILEFPLGSGFTANILTKLSTSPDPYGTYPRFGTSCLQLILLDFDKPTVVIPAPDYKWNIGYKDFCMTFWHNEIELNPGGTFSSQEQIRLVDNNDFYVVAWSSTLFPSINVRGKDTNDVYQVANLSGNTQSLKGYWNHIEVSRTNGQLYMFVNGRLTDTEPFPHYLENAKELEFQITGILYARSGCIDEFALFVGGGGHTTNFIPPSSTYDKFGNLQDIPAPTISDPTNPLWPTPPVGAPEPIVYLDSAGPRSIFFNESTSETVYLNPGEVKWFYYDNTAPDTNLEVSFSVPGTFQCPISVLPIQVGFFTDDGTYVSTSIVNANPDLLATTTSTPAASYPFPGAPLGTIVFGLSGFSTVYSNGFQADSANSHYGEVTVKLRQYGRVMFTAGPSAVNGRAGSTTVLDRSIGTKKWSLAAAGSSHVIAVASDSTVWTWGDNASGQLGNGTTTPSTTPSQITVTGAVGSWRGVSAGHNHTVAITNNGTMFTWGDNTSGQLGDGTTVSKSSSVQIPGTTWYTSSSGRDFSMARRYDNTLWAWGSGSNGRLGTNSVTSTSSPVQVGAGTDWYHAQAGSDHVIAIKNDGTLWAWGKNTSGQLGLNDTIDRSSPVQVGADTNWRWIGAGHDHTIAVKSNGTLWAWGTGVHGQLGLGVMTSTSSPVQIGSGTNWSNVTASHDHSAAIDFDGFLYTWGRNDAGQLGLGDTVNRTSPVLTGPNNIWSAFTGDMSAGGQILISFSE